LRSSTLDSLHTGVSPGSIGCAYTYSGPFREAQISEQPLWGFPQVILIIPSHVPNNSEQFELKYIKIYEWEPLTRTILLFIQYADYLHTVYTVQYKK